MNGEEGVTIKPFKIERVCEPKPDIQQLVLKEVDTTESVYTRTLVHLKDASLPHSVSDSNEARWRKVFQWSRGGDGVPPLPDGGDTSTPSPEPLPGGGRAGAGRDTGTDGRPPVIVTWGLYLMLRYRQDWRPSGYGLGELLYAISLMPNEELTLEVKTWETSKTQQDTEQEVSERFVSDIKSASSNTKESTTEDQTKTHESVDAKAGYSGFGFSASVEAQWSQDVNNMQKDFHKQTQENSQQTTNEYRATRKVKMTVSRESGSESKTTRKIKNINQAHTLNVNYYEVLREYEVKLSLYDVSLVLLGAEASLTEPLGPNYLTWWEDKPSFITVGQSIRLIRSADWVQTFIDKYGVSPIKLLREQWSAPLYDAALINADWTIDPKVQIKPDDREEFRDTLLQFVRPTPGWFEPDEKGALRWGYEILEGREQQVLGYLFQFLPYSIQQAVERITKGGADVSEAYQISCARYLQALVPSPGLLLIQNQQKDLSRYAFALLTARPVEVAQNEKILVRGMFKGTALSDFKKDFITQKVRDKITDQLKEVKKSIGEKANWKAVLPTHGVYADVALGVCSGAEDYYEIQRQFDLEMRRFEVERLRLENARLEAGNPTPTITVENPTDKTTINVDVAPTPPSRIEIRERGA